MSQKETIGSSINPKVGSQIDIREEVFKGLPENKLSAIDRIFFMNSNTGWVKLRSSVDKVKIESNKTSAAVPEGYDWGRVLLEKSPDNFLTHLTAANKSEKEDIPLSGDPSAARNFILSGGTTSAGKEANRQGINYAGFDSGSAYNSYKNTGVRPMGGITGVKVVSKNTYGTLLSAEVNFVVWDVEDLEKCEFLYFRPGYTALLEWGHTLYVEKEGGGYKLQKPSSFISDDTFFTPGSMDKIEQEIKKKRESLDYNYEGMFGFITNFNWKFRKDGGYDCNITIVSKGVILESLKANGSSSSSDKEENYTVKKLKSAFHRICTAIEDAGVRTATGGAGLVKKELGISTYDFPILSLPILHNVQEGSSKVGYMPLRTVVDIFNEVFLIKGGNSIKTLKTLMPISTQDGNSYITFPEHYSVDPLTAIPSHKTAEDGDYADFCLKGVYDVVEKNPKYVNAEDLYFEVLNILVATPFIKDHMSKLQDSTAADNTSVYDVIRDMLAGIQAALGDINSFDLQLNEDTLSYQIIDRNALIMDPAITSITVTGLGSTVLDLSMESKISNNIASQVAIAAQGSTGNYRENLENLLKWNIGALDRHIPMKRTSYETYSEVALNRQSYYEKARILWNSLLNSSRPVSSPTFESSYAAGKGIVAETTVEVQQTQYQTAEWRDLQSAGAEYLKWIYSERLKLEQVSPPAVVPVEISIKMLGISGFKIGQAFLLDTYILPSKYKDCAFLIMGLDHDIGTSNQWTTDVRALCVPGPKNHVNIRSALTKKSTELKQRISPSTPPVEMELFENRKDHNPFSLTVRSSADTSLYVGQTGVHYLMEKEEETGLIKPKYHAVFKDLASGVTAGVSYINRKYFQTAPSNMTTTEKLVLRYVGHGMSPGALAEINRVVKSIQDISGDRSFTQNSKMKFRGRGETNTANIKRFVTLVQAIAEVEAGLGTRTYSKDTIFRTSVINLIPAAMLTEFGIKLNYTLL